MSASPPDAGALTGLALTAIPLFNLRPLIKHR